MLANQLARRGVKPLIIDRHSGPAQQTRAIGRAGAHAGDLRQDGHRRAGARARPDHGTGANMWANGRCDGAHSGRRHRQEPQPVSLHPDAGAGRQRAHHGRASSGARRGRSQWNTELIALEQKADHVDARLKQPDGTIRAVTAAWVAGCDGSRSAVREMSRIGFPGAPYEQTFFVADTEATGSMKPGELNVYLWRDGFHLFFPMRGKDRWRVIGILPEQFCARERRDVRRADPVDAAAKPGPTSTSSTATGSRPIASSIAPPNASATAVASCSAMPRTSTARRARRA